MTDSTQTAEQLLKRVSETVKVFEEQYRETSMSYNIFKVIDADDDEVKTCRVLADLLNPKGQHYRGSVYLERFIDMVVKPFIEKAEKLDLSKVNVKTELRINENRRIDIVLDDGTIFLPIEVKINAAEQPNQLADYAKFSKIMNADTDFIPVLFLTPDGRKSSEKTSKDNEYVPISFKKHIIPWLEECFRHEEKGKALPVKEILRQFIKAIKSFCGSEDETMEKAIEDIIIESNNYEAALLVSNAVNKLDFSTKAREIFIGKICELVKSEPLDAGPNDEKEENWYGIDFTVEHICVVNINYDMKTIYVDWDKFKKDDAETADKIGSTMSKITRSPNESCGKDHIWTSTRAEYPGLERKVDDKLYMYKLYQIYSKEPEIVAKWIVNMANELKKNLEAFLL